ncbi:MAG: glycosyltransferase, partial [Candidatus Bathyarchaeota archaeon]
MSVEIVAFSLMWFLTSITYLVHGTYLAFSFFSINTKLRQKVWVRPLLSVDAPLCLIIPLYKEDTTSIVKTFTSLADQDYSRNLVRVVVVVEKDDDLTLNSVRDELFILNEAGFKVEVVLKPPPRSTKASAINYVLALTKEQVIGIYDGGDVIVDKQQLRRAVALLATGCEGVGVKVIRGGNSVLSTFSMVDTTMWCDVTLPALTRILNTTLLSGEGLFLRKDALDALGGFPESLTEDAHLSLLFAQHGMKMFLLDSFIYEGAPLGWSNLIRQKLRWHKGEFICLRKTLTAPLPIRRKVALVLAYSAPMVLIAIAFSYLTIILFMLAPQAVPSFLLWWSYFVALTTLTAPIYLARANY